MARQRPTQRPRMGPCIVVIDRIVISDAQYQFEVNRCRNEEVNFQCSSANSVGGDSGQDGRTDVQEFHAHGKFQGSSANSVGGDSGQDGRTDGGDNHIIPTFTLQHSYYTLYGEQY
ncbi:hypothetical protein DPMN_059519 [Dreissena polymorpha]|uniref:Uncharacterized protein n=1 Tax=Dreissena polymorpha TaxID=45954 RepID=A0A9D4C472_DREPO|nr:hypothetical protein DPMN_059519 [Dreissena polymorpha]